MTYTQLQQLRKQAADGSTSDYLNQLRTNVKARGKVETQDLPVANLATGAAIIGARTPAAKTLTPSEFHSSPAQYGGVLWNDPRFLAYMTWRNHLWNPYEKSDPRYLIAERYIDERAKENRERYKNDSIKDNPNTQVEFPVELDDERGRQLKEWGYGFASNNIVDNKTV